MDDAASSKAFSKFNHVFLSNVFLVLINKFFYFQKNKNPSQKFLLFIFTILKIII